MDDRFNKARRIVAEDRVHRMSRRQGEYAIEGDADTYIVKTVGVGLYVPFPLPRRASCTCRDYTERQKPVGLWCKHIAAVCLYAGYGDDAEVQANTDTVIPRYNLYFRGHKRMLTASTSDDDPMSQHDKFHQYESFVFDISATLEGVPFDGLSIQGNAGGKVTVTRIHKDGIKMTYLDIDLTNC